MMVSKKLVMPRNILRKPRKSDVNDAVLNSEYDEKLKISREKEKICSMLTRIRAYILEIDPKIENYLDVFRGCHEQIKKIRGMGNGM